VRRMQSKTIKGEFYVDFVREAYLNRYLNAVDRERQKIAERLRRKRKILRENVARQLHDLTSAKKNAS
jgi:glucose-6-phosphate-specific signal transduction histidine kinase